MRSLIPPGAPIAVIAPCSAYDPNRFERGLDIARDAGLDLHPFPGLLEPVRYLASSDERRLSHLVEALKDPRWGAIWIARGGFGMTRLLQRVPWEDLPPRPVIGFSDVTPLLEALRARVGGPVIHGPVVHSLPQTDEASRAHLFDLLAGRPTPPLVGEPLVDGEATGTLLGGNLTMLASTCGTPFQVDARDAILVLEEVGEAPYRVDRSLQQLSSSGVFDQVRGIALGQFTDCDPPFGAGWKLSEILDEHLGELGVPVVSDLPIGHGSANRAFVIGARARLAEGTLSWDYSGIAG